jgi:hypothetical protein
VADSIHPVLNVAKCQECTADACGVALRTVQSIIIKGKSLFNTQGCVNFELPGKNWQKV